METELLLHWISSDNGLVVHISIFGLLLLGGFGFPIPEDVPLLLAGIASSQGIVSIELIWITCYVGVMAADLLLYFAGYFFGGKILEAGTRSKFFPAITEKSIERIRNGLRKRRLTIIFIGRHLFPVRTVTFLTTGALKVPFLEFLLADGIAALVSVTIVVSLGYYLGGQLTPEVISHFIQQAHVYVSVFLIFLVLYYMARWRRKNREQAAAAEVALVQKEDLRNEA